MSAIYPLNIHRRIELQWAARIKALSQIRSQFVVATTRTLKHVVEYDGSLLPVAVRTVDQRKINRPRPRD
jgi:hypothetical protein